MELPDTVQLVIVRGQPARMTFARPAGTGLRTDDQRTELVEREYSLQELAAHRLDPGEFRLAVGVGGFLPRLRPLERDRVLDQQQS